MPNIVDFKPIAIIDIGSNSMRLVVYDGLKRAPVPLYNEKVMCQLGKGLSSTGRLNPEGAELARGVMRRFLAMARNMSAASTKSWLKIWPPNGLRPGNCGKSQNCMNGSVRMIALCPQ